MLYTMITDDNHRGMVWDKKQIESIVGDMRTAMEKRIDMWTSPRSYKGVFNEPLKVSFPVLHSSDEKKNLPDICDVQGRLFLTPKAYEVLEPLISGDGEFLSLIYEKGEAYFFTPLRVAEQVGALDTALSKRNEWGDLENLAFHEDKLNDWSVFRCEYNHFQTLQCQQHVKDAVENANLKGLCFTPELGRVFALEQSKVSKLN